jgi:excisionase family DNA binding protein
MAPSRGGVSRHFSPPHSSEHVTSAPLHNGQPLLLRAEDAAPLLGVSVRAIYRLAAEHKIPAACVVRLGRSVRFSRPALLRWLHGEDAQRAAGDA